MSTRTTSKIVSFAKPFVLGALGEVLPAGDYAVDTDEELLQGVSFPVYCRVLTTFHLKHASGNPLLERTMTIDPKDLDAALTRDRELPDPAISDGNGRPHQTQDSHEPRQPADRDSDDRAENEGMKCHARQPE